MAQRALLPDVRVVSDTVDQCTEQWQFPERVLLDSGGDKEMRKRFREVREGQPRAEQAEEDEQEVYACCLRCRTEFSVGSDSEVCPFCLSNGLTVTGIREV